MNTAAKRHREITTQATSQQAAEVKMSKTAQLKNAHQSIPSNHPRVHRRMKENKQTKSCAAKNNMPPRIPTPSSSRTRHKSGPKKTPLIDR
jgi:hypothetical protein